MLQIGIHHHHGVAGGVIDPAVKCDLMPEVAGQREHPQRGIGLAEPVELGEGVVGATVVDDHHLEVEVVERLEHRPQRLVEGGR